MHSYREPRIQLSLMLLVSLACPILACGVEGALYHGTTGKAVPIKLITWVPTVAVGLRHPDLPDATGTLLVDTGAPLTALDQQTYPSLQLGSQSVTLAAFSLTFQSYYPTVIMRLFSGGSPCEDSPAGLIGGDLLRHFRFGLDYQGARVFLFDGDGQDPAVGESVESAEEVSIEVRGGGQAVLDKEIGAVQVPATRIVAEGKLEEKSITAMIDTGASYTVISKKLFDTLSTAGRPSLCCASVSTAYGVARAKISRVKELRLGTASVKNMPVLVFTDESMNRLFFDALAGEAKRDVALIVGGSYLRRFAVLVDYGSRTLELARYKAQAHVNDREFVGPGFTFCKGKDPDPKKDKPNLSGMVIQDVYEGTDAAKRSISPLSILVAVDGQSVLDKTATAVQELFSKMTPGATTRLSFKGIPNSVQRDVLVETLLPDFK